MTVNIHPQSNLIRQNITKGIQYTRPCQHPRAQSITKLRTVAVRFVRFVKVGLRVTARKSLTLSPKVHPNVVIGRFAFTGMSISLQWP
jgi:hypothetical protein